MSERTDVVSIEGSIERHGDDLVLRIPLETGGFELAPYASGVGEIDEAGCLCIVIEQWMADHLRVFEGSIVIVDNEDGKLRITRSKANDRRVH